MHASIILLLPFFSALVILLGHRQLKGAAVLISVGSSIISFIACLALLAAADDKENTKLLLPFLDIGYLHANIDVLIDKQSRGMMFIVSFIGMLVHIFSLGYMKDDDAKPRFFGSLSLFMFSMTGIVLAGNLIMMFIFWELVGLSSYLLIGHWYQKASAAEACKKAFLTNRIGDFGFMIGILLLFGANGGSVNIEDLTTAFGPGGTLGIHAPGHSAGFTTAAALCIFLGAVGKSAQFPLHVWLPDAMEGPTPVSALIHAATMVAAGVYMLVRVRFLIEASPLAAEIIAGIGAVTALMAALMATQQNDIKRILAYSTLSQLGYMVMAVGAVAMSVQHGHELHGPNPGHPAMFHLYTHAFFKAMLFLGSGAIIYACHHEQDIWKMGGLRKHMPVTFYTFLIGTLALMGLPWITSGFYSKEAILGAAYDSGCSILFHSASLTALLTSFYMMRLVIVAFFGKSRTDSARHAKEVEVIMLLPLVILAVFSVFSAWKTFADTLQAYKPAHEEPHATVLFASIAAFLIGTGGAIYLYRGKDKDPINIKLFANKFYFDEIYAVIVRVCQDRLAWIVTALERVLVDGLVARLPTAIVARLGAATRMLQGGHLQGYTFLLGGGVIAVIYLVVFVLPRLGH
ncbi:MAG: NADH-quinone oxidoreductase subunit L [Prosthecobacter sp.]|uniref:NADH-quinone oxidoreductase subunit L n=1 Tax=Prosthecobacter sp. TaxID=1965333 RepID=UPI0025DCE983|nr:NADH-quinone oxidoreductase subunit L [Prosthecobacter sp.]MCF7786965.1 NADH-quinone oxidoreductase subunit L [Prosthecobacter sp.]